jgi:hypothetical protein
MERGCKMNVCVFYYDGFCEFEVVVVAEVTKFINGVIIGQDMAQRKVNIFLNRCINENLYDIY